MLIRFCLYGFLKNQRYFEPFFYLALLEKGLGFFEIGLLIAFREVVVNLIEVPTGSLADIGGRRASMIVSFVAYVASFLLFGFTDSLVWLLPAMFFFAVGESFRSGTHKAMIFTWLRMQGRQDERTRVYGFTRSWSQIGSAVSVLIGALLVFRTGRFGDIFLWSTIPYVLNIVNFLGYPRALEGEQALERGGGAAALWKSMREVLPHTLDTLRTATRPGMLRRLMLESMGFEGVFDAVKDYLQPALKLAALGLASLGLAAAWIERTGWSEGQRAAVLIGVVYFVLYVLSAATSRNAHRVEATAGGVEGAARWMWAVVAAVYGLILGGSLAGVSALVIGAFVVLHSSQALWRPLIISRFDAHSDESQGATVLSIESQSQRIATMIVAPAVGWMIDALGGAEEIRDLWPIGAIGLAVSAGFLLKRPRAAAAAG